MQRFEYKVIPGPRKADKAKGLKATEDRFAYALSVLMNDLGREGWEYLRADTLPCDERVGLTGSKTTFQTVLVFRRSLAEDAEVAPPADVLPPLSLSQPVVPGSLPRIGAAEAPVGAAPVLGPAKADHAAE